MGRPLGVADCISLASPSGQSLLVPSLRLSNANPLHWALRWGPPDGGLCGRVRRPAPTGQFRSCVGRWQPIRRCGIFPHPSVGEGLAPPVISLEGLSLYAVGVGHRPARRVTTAEIRSRAIRRARLVLHRANPPAQRESGTFSGPPPAGRVDFFKMPLTFPLVEGVS